MSLLVMAGDRIRFNSWQLYQGETVPDISPDQYTGEVLESWGVCRTFFRVKRDHDGRKVIMFQEDVAEVIGRKSDIPRNKFAAAAAGHIPAAESTKKAGSGAGRKEHKIEKIRPQVPTMQREKRI